MDYNDIEVLSNKYIDSTAVKKKIQSMIQSKSLADFKGIDLEYTLVKMGYKKEKRYNDEDFPIFL